MKFTLFDYEETVGYAQVDEDVYEERIIPAISGIQYKDCTRDEIDKISEYCDHFGIWHISDLIYFDDKQDRVQFLLTFG